MNRSSKDMPRLSVIVPLWRPKRSLEEIESILTPDLPENSEVILAWDGPSESNFQTNPRFRVTDFNRHRGIAFTLNRAVSQARGNYVCFLDQDDFLAPNSFRTRLEAIEKIQTRVLLGQCHKIVKEDQTTVEKPTRALQARNQNMPKYIDTEYLSNGGWFPLAPLGCAIFERELLIEHPFDTSLSTAFDMEFFFRIARSEWSIPVIQSGVLEVCVHDSNHSIRFDGKLIPSARNKAERWLIKQANGANCDEFIPT